MTSRSTGARANDMSLLNGHATVHIEGATGGNIGFNVAGDSRDDVGAVFAVYDDSPCTWHAVGTYFP